MPKKLYPKPIQDFLDKKQAYEKKAPLVIGEYLEVSYFEVTDDSRLPEYGEMGEIIYGDLHLWDRVAFSDEKERYEFKKDFVSLIQHELEDSMSGIVFGVLLSEEDEGFPVYYFGDRTEGKLEKISDKLEYFVSQYFDTSKKSNDPKKILKDIFKKIEKAYKKEDYKEILKLTDGFLTDYADFIKNLHSFDLDNKRKAGALYNFKGLALEHEGKWKEAVEAFEKSEALGDDNGLLNLIDGYCYKLKEYEKARKLSRKFVMGDYAWYHTVKVDAYASMMLKDKKPAEKYYRMLHDKFLYSDHEKIAQARQELEDSGTALAKEILEWFGVADGSADDVDDLRKWWKSLSKAWQDQFKLLLTDKIFSSAREEVKKMKEPTDDQLRHIVTRTKLHMDHELAPKNAITSLEPLQKLKHLKKLRLSHWYDRGHCEDFLGDISRLTSLENLEMTEDGLVLENLNFLKPLKKLTDLNLSGSYIYSLEALTSLKELNTIQLSAKSLVTREVKRDQEKVLKDMSPLGKIGSLKTLRLSDIDQKDFSFLKGAKKLKELSIYKANLPSLKGIEACESLEELTLMSCKGLTDLKGIEKLKKLKDLEISYCDELEDVTLLVKLASLESLDINSRSIKNISFLSGLKKLKVLTLDSLPIESLKPLTKLFSLETLFLRGEMKIKDLETLAELKSLKKLSIRSGYSNNTPVHKDQIKAFQRARPEVEVVVR